jgi:hypothetical protein
MTKSENNKYQQFWFEGFVYNYDAEKEVFLIELNYSLDKKVNFQEKLQIPLEAAAWEKVDLEALKRAISAFHIMAGISYYKTYLPREMAGLELTSEQAAFWQKIYQRGLGEFFYSNQIDFRGLINFPYSPIAQPTGFSSKKLSERALLPIGGGKDSIVSAEILKNSGLEFQQFSLRDAEPIRATAEAIGKPREIVQRQLDSQLFQLNEQGAYNGHVPITAYISFLLIVCAILGDYRYIVMSLEKSANEGQLLFHGMDINHQYSKSEEFEEDLRNYVSKYIDGEVEYFSLLRGYNELRIAEIFAGLEDFDKYAPVFSSCNANFKINKTEVPKRWCGHCPKCAFVFLILAAFVPREKLLGIFGENLLNKPELMELHEELLGLRNFKPFECVGTIEESQIAFWLIAQKPEWQNDLLVKYFVTDLAPRLPISDWETAKAKVLKTQETPMIAEVFKQYLPK